MTKTLHSTHTKEIMGGGFIALFLSLILLCFNYSPAYAEDTTDVYRLWEPITGEHLYTTDWGETSYLNSNTDWIYEGTAFKAGQEGHPVYRLYNPYGNVHHLTNDAHEKEILVSNGWNYEGVIFNSDIGKRIPVYRLYCAPYHLWTTDYNEYATLPSAGWSQEGIAFYAADYGQMLPADQKKQPPTAEDLFSREWAPRIDRYNAGWPLGGYGDAFARAAYRNGMDPRVAPAIARIESGSGRVPLYRYGAGNCWGWMSPLTNDFESSIYLYCEKFSRQYGSTLTYAGAASYAGYSGYANIVYGEMNKI